MFKRLTEYDTHAKQRAEIKYTDSQKRLYAIMVAIREGYTNYLTLKDAPFPITKTDGIQSAFGYDVTPIVNQFDLSKGIYPVLKNMAEAIRKEYPVKPTF